jgi:phosphoribosylformylglycinamidine synthase subunit PurS
MAQRAGKFNASKMSREDREDCKGKIFKVSERRALLGREKANRFELSNARRSVRQNFSARFRQFLSPKSFRARMKAKIIITPKKAVVDPQGITVLKALEHMGHRGIKAVHVGKYLEIELDATDKEAARKSLDEAAHKFLSNPVIEDYRLEIE